eukprot:Skav225642  [mRNA]  locus=scaffold1716:304236:310004:- [translate_table: standard]
MATKFVYDLLKVVTLSQPAPDVWFGFDCTTTGNQAAGLWACRAHPELGKLVRGLMTLCEACFACDYSHWHIRGHAGDPGNELVDTLAFAAAHGSPLTNDMPFLETMLKPAAVADVEWFWCLVNPPLGAQWDGHHMCFDCAPHDHPTVDVLAESSLAPAVDPQQLHVRVKALSCNVLTLKDTKSPELTANISIGPARQQALTLQIFAADVHMFALQETRLRRVTTLFDPRFFLCHSHATPTGLFGTLIGFAKDQPYAVAADGREFFFQEHHFAVIHSQPRTLIIRVAADGFRCICISAHAPHSGATLSEIEQYWNAVDAAIPTKYDNWKLVLFTDCNTRVGSEPDHLIGDHQAEAQTSKSEPFISFLHKRNVWLPATHSANHRGPGGTWRHNNGNWLRNDFVGLSVDWPAERCLSQVEQHIDVALVKEDHLPVSVTWSFTSTEDVRRFQQASPKLALECLDETKLASLSPETIGPHVDVHTHATLLQKQLQTCFRRPSFRPRKPLKASLTPETWSLICHKKRWRSHLHASQRQQRQNMMRACLLGWRTARNGGLTDDDRACYHALQRRLDHLIASALARFRQLGRHVIQALHRDDLAFFSSLTSEAAEFLNPADVKQFWKVVQRTLPRHRQKRMHPKPMQLVAFEDDWAPYFQKLEAGYSCTAEELIEHCRCEQDRVVPHTPSRADLPSLREVEDALRQVKSNKATGMDPVPSGLAHAYPHLLARLVYPLYLKVFLQQVEPISFRGGVMCVLPKRADFSEVGHFRGIMLLSTLAKRLHALLRARLLKHFECRRPEFQIGGWPHQEVMFGSQMLQVLGRIAHRKGLSYAVLFVDLANAFHRLVRECVLGVSQPDALHRVLLNLQEAGFPTEQLEARLHRPGVLEQHGVPEYLLQLLRSVHSSTWFRLAGAANPSQTCNVTCRGTRPGSPLADMIFHILMIEVCEELTAYLRQEPEMQLLLEQIGAPVHAVVWSDDLAIPIVSGQVELMIPAVQRLLAFVHNLFRSKGFDLNLSRGKTSAVLSLQGPAAPTVRKEFLLIDRPGVDCCLSDGSVVFLHFTPHYRHLGTHLSSSLTLDAEIAHRIGSAKAAFRASQKLLCSRHLPAHIRVRLYRALVESRLFFGLGAWGTPTFRQLQRLRTVSQSFLQKTLRLPLDALKQTTTVPLFAQAQVPDPRIRLAIDRLLFARRLFRFGPSCLHHLLHFEHSVCVDSWMHGLFADMEWLCSLSDVPMHWCGDLTEAIDRWQSPDFPWKSILQKAWRKHLQQETLTEEAFHLHKMILQVFTQAGGELDCTLARPDCREAVHPCFCGAVFTTPQGLAAHKRLKHQIHSLEHDLVSDATCPVCMKHFWCTARLCQHLTYISRVTGINACYQELRRKGFSTTYEALQAPKHLFGNCRNDAIQACGPVMPLEELQSQRIAAIQEQIDRAAADLSRPPGPQPEEACYDALIEQLTTTTMEWFQAALTERDFAAMSDQLPDAWLECFLQFPEWQHAWCSAVFMDWGQQHLPDLQSSLVDGEAEQIIEDAYYDLVTHLPQHGQQQHLDSLRALQQRIRADAQKIFPHRPVKTGSANATERLRTIQRIPQSYLQQYEWQDRLRCASWTALPAPQSVPVYSYSDGKPCFLFVHLFSGRRRNTDAHAHLHRWAEEHQVCVRILSLDTAVSSTLGDLSLHGTNWPFVLQCYQAGAVAGTISGSPCETFTEARFNAAPDDLPEEVRARWPRPLRSRACLFGIPGLTPRELRQLRQGSSFFLQTVLLLAWQYVHGGYFLAEHPAVPTLEDRPSIWTSAILTAVRQLPFTHLLTLQQWLWGADAIKPTGLLTLRLPRALTSMNARRTADPVRPTKGAIGLNDSGQFCTAHLKEYPPDFSAALAGTLGDQLLRDLSTGNFKTEPAEISEDVRIWVEEMASCSAVINDHAVFLPDYQGV